MITVVIIIVIINIVTVVGTIIFLNKKNIENEEKMLLNQINENNQQNFEENKKKFDEIEKTISLNAKNNLLEGINNLQNKLSENNEKLLLRFNQLGQNLSGTMNDNNQLLSKNHTENSQLLTSSMNNNIQKLSVRLNENNTALTGVMTENNQNLTKNINEFKDGLTKNINENFEKLSQKIENRLDVMNMKVEERLSKGFEETTKTFGNVLERLSKIDEAQKKIEALSSNVVSLQDILTDKKSRGIFGEIQLYQILSSVFGEKNDKLYQKQYKLSNGNIVDSIIFTPEPLGNIAVDSKFPLENYRKMFLAMGKDIRVILIKLADRLHNIRTLKFLKRDRQIAIAQETIDLYAPLANRLGVFSMKWELEDQAFKYLYPEEYREIVEGIAKKREERLKFIDQIVDEIKINLKKEKIVYIFVDKEKLDAIQENNQGIIASINPFEYVEIDEILKEKEIRNEDSFILVLDKIEDTHNLGAIIRVAEAAGVHGIIIPKRNAAGVTPLTIKTSAGAVSHIKIARVTNIVQTLKELKEKGMWVVGTDLDTDNMYTKTNLTGDMAVVIGNEEKGISRLVKEECDILVKIPMIGKVQSLNASVSAGIIIYEIIRQRLEKLG